MTTRQDTWEVFEIDEGNTKIVIGNSPSFILDTKNMSEDDKDDAADSLARKIKKISEKVLQVAVLDDQKYPVLKDNTNKTIIALNYDPGSKCFEYLDSGAQGALVFAKVPFDKFKNYEHAYTTLEGYVIAEQEIHKEEHIGKHKLIDLLKDTRAKAKKQIKKIGKKKLRKYVDNKIGHLFPEGNCVLKLYHLKQGEHLAIREGVMQGLRHKNLAYTFAQGKARKNGGNGGWYYVAMEYVALISERKKSAMSFNDRIGVIEQVLACQEEALLPAGVLHRDIKPQNMLLFDLKDLSNKERKQYVDKNGKQYRIGMKLADFGLLKTVRTKDKTSQTIAGLFLGTPEYAAPETAAASFNQDPHYAPSWQGELFSTGASLYSILTGLCPNQAKDDEGVSMLMNLIKREHKTVRPSETKQLWKYLDKEFKKDNRTKKKVAYWTDLVLSGMMWENRIRKSNDKLEVERKLRYRSYDDCIHDLCSIKEGKAPEKIKKWLKYHKIDEEKYIQQVFNHYNRNVPDDKYVDAMEAANKQSGKGKLRRWIKGGFGCF